MKRARKRDWTKQNTVFAALLQKTLVELGAVEEPAARGVFGAIYAYKFETKAGVLRLSVSPHASIHAGAMVAGRFDDVDAGHELTGNSNPYSGKWNHHYFTDDVDTSIADLRRTPEKVRA
jgi:hypothetical protein